MNKKTIVFLIVTIITTNFLSSCKAQMVQTTQDAQKLVENKAQFIGKPLKNLLKEIKPPIKSVSVQEGDPEHTSVFRFFFVDNYLQNKGRGKLPLTIRVYVKEHFLWDYSKKDWNKWTAEDLLKYGDLTVIEVRVYGQDE